jgi:uncharacterized protein YabN with tetrapyrrole methylase and pyrophosphatase domain
LDDVEATMSDEQQRPIDRLLAIMARLRDPHSGCPWDKEQTFSTIAPYTIEEAYEVAEAIAQADMGALREELGDLLLQVVYHAQMAQEAGAFAFEDVATAIADKMVSRHPHVFGDTEVADAAAQTRGWEQQKDAERLAKARAAGLSPSVLDDVPAALPALTRAEKLQKRAARATPSLTGSRTSSATSSSPSQILPVTLRRIPSKPCDGLIASSNVDSVSWNIALLRREKSRARRR